MQYFFYSALTLRKSHIVPNKIRPIKFSSTSNFLLKNKSAKLFVSDDFRQELDSLHDSAHEASGSTGNNAGTAVMIKKISNGNFNFQAWKSNVKQIKTKQLNMKLHTILSV